MDIQKYTTITLERDTLKRLRATDIHVYGADALINELIDMHNNLKQDMGL